MAETRSKKAPEAPFAGAGAAIAEAMLAPAKSAGLVAAYGEPSPIATAVTDTVAIAASAMTDPTVVLPSVVDPLPTAEPLPATATTPPPFLKGLLTMATAPEMTYAATDRFQSMFGDMNERARTAVEKSTKLAEELTELTKGNVEAFVASGRVAAKGAETLTQDAAEYGKKSFESATGALKSFAAVKSPTELFQLQSDYAKSSFDTAVAEASKLSESMLKLMGEIAQPLSTRYAVAAEKFKTTAI